MIEKLSDYVGFKIPTYDSIKHVGTDVKATIDCKCRRTGKADITVPAMHFMFGAGLVWVWGWIAEKLGFIECAHDNQQYAQAALRQWERIPDEAWTHGWRPFIVGKRWRNRWMPKLRKDKCVFTVADPYSQRTSPKIGLLQNEQCTYTSKGHIVWIPPDMIEAKGIADYELPWVVDVEP